MSKKKIRKKDLKKDYENIEKIEAIIKPFTPKDAAVQKKYFHSDWMSPSLCIFEEPGETS